MEIKVQDIPPEGLRLSYQEDPAQWGLDEKELSLEGKVHVHLKVIKQCEGDVYIRGAIEAELLSECSRCLKHFSNPIRSDFHVEYTPMPQIFLEEERTLSSGELDLNYYQGEAIELNEEIKGQLFLAVPMRPLCQPDCHGLCPHCGEDLNQTSCSCPSEFPDVRWAGLKDLFK